MRWAGPAGARNACNSRTSCGKLSAASGVRRKALQRELVGSRRAAESEIDAAREQPRQRSELFGDDIGGMVGKHDAARADPDASSSRQRCEQSQSMSRRWRCPACCDAPPPRAADSPISPRAPQGRGRCRAPRARRPPGLRGQARGWKAASCIGSGALRCRRMQEHIWRRADLPGRPVSTVVTEGLTSPMHARRGHAAPFLRPACLDSPASSATHRSRSLRLARICSSANPRAKNRSTSSTERLRVTPSRRSAATSPA